MPSPSLENQQVSTLDGAIHRVRRELTRGWWHRLLHPAAALEAVVQIAEAARRDTEVRDARASAADLDQQSLLEKLNSTLVQHEQQLIGWANTQGALGLLSAQVSALAAHATAVQAELSRLADDQAKLQTTLQAEAAATEASALKLNEQLGEVQAQLSPLLNSQGPTQQAIVTLSSQATASGREITRLAAEGNALALSLQAQTTSLGLFATKLNRQLADHGGQLETLLRERGPDRTEEFSRFYLAFENEFRGSREEITARQKAYLPSVTAALARTTGKVWVDLGCGRGEWLEMVRETGATTIGIDDNAAMLQTCRERGLLVVNSDALAFLEKTTPASLAGVSAFHLIEHLPYRTMLALVNSAWAALAPGGCLILETPNPQNVSVGACNFYMDVTHRNPIPPTTAEFIARHAGFSVVTVLRLHPYERHAERDTLPTVTEREYCEMFYGPRDYAIIAIK